MKWFSYGSFYPQAERLPGDDACPSVINWSHTPRLMSGDRATGGKISPKRSRS